MLSLWFALMTTLTHGQLVVRQRRCRVSGSSLRPRVSFSSTSHNLSLGIAVDNNLLSTTSISRGRLFPSRLLQHEAAYAAKEVRRLFCSSPLLLLSVLLLLLNRLGRLSGGGRVVLVSSAAALEI